MASLSINFLCFLFASFKIIKMARKYSFKLNTDNINKETPLKKSSNNYLYTNECKNLNILI